MQDNGYRIIKLKNGDSLITKILEFKKTTLTLERPMQYKTVMLMNQATMSNTEVLIFKNWIDYTMDLEIEISVDGILAISIPDVRLSNCYDLEKEKEDTASQQPQLPLHDATDQIINKVSDQQPTSNNVNITFSVPQEMAEEIVEMMAEAKAWENLDEDFEDEDEDEEETPTPVPPKKKTNKKKNTQSKPNKGKKNKPNNEFGNDWQDWSPDPKDYLS